MKMRERESTGQRENKRQYQSIFALVTGQSIKPLLLSLAVLIVVQVTWFMVTMPSEDSLAGLVDLIEKSLKVPFLIALIGMWMAITASHTRGQSKIGYTMRRLGISQNKMAVIFGLNMLLCFIILWVTEVLVIVGLSQIFLNQIPPELYSNQSLFLGSYSSDFFHKILPLHDWRGWVTLGLTGFVWVISHVTTVVERWNGKGGRELFVLITAIAFWQLSMGGTTFGGMLFHIILVGIMVFVLFSKIMEVQSDES